MSFCAERIQSFLWASPRAATYPIVLKLKKKLFSEISAQKLVEQNGTFFSFAICLHLCALDQLVCEIAALNLSTVCYIVFFPIIEALTDFENWLTIRE